MRFRKLRIVWSVVCGIVCLLLIVLWVRAASRCDTASVQLFQLPKVSALSVLGHLVCGIEQPDASGTKISFDSVSFQSVPEARAAFEEIQTFRFSALEQPGIWGIIVPHYVAILALSAAAAAPWLHRRFSLRTLLISTTLVAVVLGLIVYAAGK